MLKMSINRSATLQIEVAAAYAQTIPNRIASAQSSALESVKRKAPNELSKFGRAAKYLDISVSRFGSIGMKMTVSPSKKKGSAGKHGYNLQAATTVLLAGRRGGRIVTAKKAGAMKVRPESVQKGYSKFYRAITLAPIKSKKQEIKKYLRDMVLAELKAKLKIVGIGPRGGVTRSTDFSSVRSV